MLLRYCDAAVLLRRCGAATTLLWLLAAFDNEKKAGNAGIEVEEQMGENLPGDKPDMGSLSETPGVASSVADIVGICSPVEDLLINIPHFPEEESPTRANEIFPQGGGDATALAGAKFARENSVMGHIG